MKIRTALILSALGAIGITGWKYYRGVYELQYNLGGIGLQGDQVAVDLIIFNPTHFTYPVPMMFFNVYDVHGTYFGMLSSNVMQWVKPGPNRVQAYLLPNVQNVLASLASLLIPGASLELMLDGTITIGGKAIPLQIPIEQTLSL